MFYTIIYTANNTELGKELMVPSYLFFDLNKRSNCIMVWGAQCFGFCGAAMAYSSTDSFVIAMIIHLSAQINILRQALIKLNDDDASTGSTIFREKLAVIVKRHNTLTQLAGVIKDAVDLMLLAMLLVYTIQLGLQLFRLMVVRINHSILIALLLFMLCK